MSRITYVNGAYVASRDAVVSVEDRGYQFGDGVYEVCEVYDGALIDEARHLDRLGRSLKELRIEAPVNPGALKVILREIRARNRLSDGYLYIQVTRGVAKRDHVFPDPPVRASLVVSAKAIAPEKGEAAARKGVGVATMPDLRWKRVDIKSIGLLANVLARQDAKEQGAYEAWLVDSDGMISEGAASNAWIVDQSGAIVTRQLDHSILRGVTRTTLFDIIAAEGLRLEERKFSLKEALAAQEAFITGATTLVMPVVAIDGVKIGDGAPGPLARKLRALFHLAAAHSN
ncbi:aminotransferase class IV [Methylocella silvestris BL2]|uniref:Probable branched-chain-amino-acid aminotransferase n=1 Tax=Methylocella silvestris (strain DSM 15510 / CIP 108128 / LMG 27833 / NCIMB 13906 / BL2) TaxID=395965 RepID=B8ELB7_METSB|nr:D-amino-acid transaminase [Methylocella silvestris]ACK49506.1 aminotransferase class IV [Methylocella silvestris BL2]